MARSLSNVRSELFKLFNGKLQKGKTNNTIKRKVKKRTSKSTFRRCLKWEVLVFTKHIVKVQKNFLHKHPVCHISKDACQFFSPVAPYTKDACNIGHGLFSPVAGLSLNSKNIFLQSGLTDMTTSCFN